MGECAVHTSSGGFSSWRTPRTVSRLLALRPAHSGAREMMVEAGRTCGTLGRRHFVYLLALCAAVVAWVAPASSAGTAARYVPATDVNSMYWTTQYIGATAWWNAGYTGSGVDVAVIDSGVAPVPGLDAPGKVIYGPTCRSSRRRRTSRISTRTATARSWPA